MATLDHMLQGRLFVGFTRGYHPRWVDSYAAIRGVQATGPQNSKSKDAQDALNREVFEESLAPIASTETRQAITRAESRPQALALLFMAPEFQRR